MKEEDMDFSSYPVPREDKCTLRTYHNRFRIPDPYRWLEDLNSPETTQFITQETILATNYLRALPEREVILKKLQKLSEVPLYSCVYEVNEKFYFFRRQSMQHQSVMLVQDKPFKSPRALINFNKFLNSTLLTFKFSDNGRLFAYCLGRSNTKSIGFYDLVARKKLPDFIQNVYSTNFTWFQNGIFYIHCRDETACFQTSLMFHEVGREENDLLILSSVELGMGLKSPLVSHCGRFLLLLGVIGSFSKLIFFEIRSHPQDLVVRCCFLLTNWNLKYVTNFGNDFIFLTNKGAPKSRIVSWNINKEKDLKTVVEEDELGVLLWAKLFASELLLLCYLIQCKMFLRVFTLEGKLLQETNVENHIIESSVFRTHDHFWFRCSSSLSPGTLHHFSLRSGTKLYYQSETKWDPANFVETQYHLDTGSSSVTLNIAHKKGIELNGEHPCILQAYGGFNICLFPNFQLLNIFFMDDLNGVIVTANVRGGGEFGDEWHLDGAGLRKQNALLDFQAAAEYLIQSKYTNPQLLIAKGASNGGLIAAASLNQRPDLFAAGIIKNGVLDLIRYNAMSPGHLWEIEYGSPQDFNHFLNLLSLSPVHNIKSTSRVPALFVIAGLKDTTVCAAHSLKYIATFQNRMRQAQTKNTIALLKMYFRAGHESGYPLITESADIICFLLRSLKLNYNPGDEVSTEYKK